MTERHKEHGELWELVKVCGVGLIITLCICVPGGGIWWLLIRLARHAWGG